MKVTVRVADAFMVGVRSVVSSAAVWQMTEEPTTRWRQEPSQELRRG